MKKGIYAFILLMILCLQGKGQINGAHAYIVNENGKTNLDENIKALKLYLNQIENKSIYYNYYLGDDLYTERSYISKASASFKNNNQIELYIYYTTQKYDMLSSSMISSEHGESVVFDPANISSIKLKGKLSDYSKSELGLLVINFIDEVEKHTYVQKNKNKDPTLLDYPLVYEFELPFLKTFSGNPEAIQNTLLDLKSLFKKK